MSKRRIWSLALVLALLLPLVSAMPVSAAAEGEPVTLTYFWELATDKVTPIFSDMADSPLYQELMKRLNIKIEFQHPPAGQAAEVFNLMVQSQDLPDIYERNMINDYPGGVAKAIEDGYVLALNDYMEELAPNLSKVLAENPDWDKMSKTDEGNYFAFPFIRKYEELCTWCGPIVRADWAIAQGYDIENLPNTIDGWTEMLTKFKEAGYCEYPLIVLSVNQLGDYNVLPGAWDVGWEYYVDRDGVLQYGPLEPEFKDFIAQMAKWYGDGILHPDITATIDTQTFRSYFSEGKTALIQATTVGGSMGYFYDLLKPEANDFKDFRLMGMPYPTVTGEKSRFGNKDLRVESLTATINGNLAEPENRAKLEAAFRLLDYGYSEEGSILFNGGFEGESFEFVDYKTIDTKMDVSMYGDKFIKYTDKVMANPEHPMAIAMSPYMRCHYNGPFCQELSYFVQFTHRPDQQSTVLNWVNSSDFSGNLPRMYRTVEEAERTADLDSDLRTYRLETLAQFITGSKPMDEWDSFVDGLKKLGIEELLEINRAAYARALAR